MIRTFEMTPLQELAKQEVLSLVDITIEVRGPESDAYYYGEIKNLKIYMHDDSLQIFGPKIEIRHEIEDFKSDRDLVDKFIQDFHRLLGV